MPPDQTIFKASARALLLRRLQSTAQPSDRRSQKKAVVNKTARGINDQESGSSVSREEFERKWGFPLEVEKKQISFIRSIAKEKKVKKLAPLFLYEGTKKPAPVNNCPVKSKSKSHRTPIAVLNASPLLDPATYCGFSENRTYEVSSEDSVISKEKSRILKKGEQAFLGVMKAKIKSGRPRSYALIGHGVPKELLQNHLDLADTLLRYHDNAAECSFNNFHGHLSFDWMRVRGRDGSNRASPWPLHNEPDVELQMELYLNVMTRIASRLGLVLCHGQKPRRHVRDGKDSTSISVDSLDVPRPSHWYVDISRGVRFSWHHVPKEEGHNEPVPIVQWIPRQGISAPGHVCVRLQGSPSVASKATLRRKKRLPVTLTFDACFRS